MSAVNQSNSVAVAKAPRLHLEAWAKGWNAALAGEPFNPDAYRWYPNVAQSYEAGRLYAAEAKAARLHVRKLAYPRTVQGDAPWPKHVLEVRDALAWRGIDPIVRRAG